MGLAKSLDDEGGVAVTTHVATGGVPECIEEEANEWGADPVVMGSHGQGGVSRAWLGSFLSSFGALTLNGDGEMVRTRGIVHTIKDASSWRKPA